MCRSTVRYEQLDTDLLTVHHAATDQPPLGESDGVRPMSRGQFSRSWHSDKRADRGGAFVVAAPTEQSHQTPSSLPGGCGPTSRQIAACPPHRGNKPQRGTQASPWSQDRDSPPYQTKCHQDQGPEAWRAPSPAPSEAGLRKQDVRHHAMLRPAESVPDRATVPTSLGQVLIRPDLLGMTPDRRSL